MFVNGSKRNEQSLQRTFHRCFLPSFISFAGQAVSEESLFQKSTYKKQELPITTMLVIGSKRNEQFPQMLPITFRSIQPRCFRVEDFQKSTNHEQELPVVAMFVNGSGQNEQSLQRTFHGCFLPSFGSFGKAFQRRRFFRNQPIRNKNGLWWPCLLMDQDEMNNHNRGFSIDASYQVSVHLAKRFQRRRISKNQPIRNKNRLWWPCLLTDRDGMSILNRGPSIDASYQVSDHLAKRFQRRRF